ncbi:thiamine phosphate synthase [Kroppenstedtia pulmonis]|uniref:Thiamine-phosphate synthase n=1 Tax=Kroppenstedtia pulmonis TaxID=1380685 RepID=A0A7D3Y912_9BACL|nr:thiamine phosphate synthase [Kroppenstedtia pulmonis]QKG84001.1 thiamine phosphate synthase [Kroppenstedtia pulmonis]
MPFHPSLLRLYLVMGSQDCRERDPVWVLKEAIAGGITLFQFREKHSSLHLGEAYTLGKKLRQICREHDIPFIVNDRVDLGMALDSDGFHVGQEDLPAKTVRQLTGSYPILGVSCDAPEEIRSAQDAGAHYVGTGAMYATKSKSDAGEPVGPQAIENLVQQPGCPPIVGIGGIRSDRVDPVIQAGAEGVAVISAISAADDPRSAAGELREAVEKSLSCRRSPLV